MVQELHLNIMDEDWDYLIVLDACRYDYFSKLYTDYLHGELRKAISQGSATLEWCKKSFQKTYEDVVYVSANPYINSKGEVKGFNASNHFYKIVDVWNWGWNDDIGTVHPETVNEAVQNAKEAYPDKRLIIHYMQPHEPFLGYDSSIPGFPQPRISRDHHPLGGICERHYGIVEISMSRLLSYLAKPTGLLGRDLRVSVLRKVSELLNLPPVSPLDAVRRRFGDTGLRLAYVQNLKLVLEYVARLSCNLSGLIVITADHGERLGEGGKYSHVYGSRDRLLLEVPWCLVEKAISRPDDEELRLSRHHKQQKLGKEGAKKIRKRLTELGYL